MLTPMMVQYVVGLCSLHHDPDAIDVTIGDMVMDVAAGKERDVDVTVTIRADNDELSAFKAAEVKHEGKALDVVTIEQLCLKLADMPKVTHKAIFSTSGYTDGARSKAAAHNVELYTFQPWDRPIEDDFPDFPGVKKPSEFLAHFESSLLYWADFHVYLVAPEGPSSFTYEGTTPVFTQDGKAHAKFSTMRQYQDEILMRSTGVLCMQEPATTILRTFPYGLKAEECDYFAGPSWPHTHTLDLERDQAFLRIGQDRPFQIRSVTISGHLEWRRRKREPKFFILERVSDQAIFAGAAIADYGVDDGRMFAMIFPDKGGAIGIHRFEISEKQKNMIHKLKLKMPS